MLNIEVNSEKAAEEFVQEFIDVFMHEYAVAIRDDAKTTLEITNTNDTGGLSESIKVKKIPKGYQVKAEAPHAIYIEYGTLPHWAPIAPLKAWARRKLGDEGAAYAVQRKIAEKGTKAKPFMEPAFHAGFDLAFDSTARRLFK